MARKRMIDPDFWIDEDLASCTRDARLLFIGLWNFADDEGKLQDSPVRIKAQVFPYDADMSTTYIDALLWELAIVGCIKRYTIDGKNYVWVPKFLKHQKISHAATSTLPNYEANSDRTPEDSGALASALPQSKLISITRSIQLDSETESSAEPIDPRQLLLRRIEGYYPGLWSGKLILALKETIAQYGPELVGKFAVEPLSKEKNTPQEYLLYLRGCLKKYVEEEA